MIDLFGFGPQLLVGATVTLKVAVTSLVCGLVVGLLGAGAKLSGVSFLRRAASVYTTIVRGVPELLIILMLYFGGGVAVTALFGQHAELNAFAAGVLALTVVFGAYATEVFRASILAVPQGQTEAARSLGLTKAHVLWLIVLPQMWRHALPGLGNLWLTLLKDTALISVVGLDDLTRKAGMAAGSTRDPLTFYSAAAAIYLALTTASLILLAMLERRVNMPVRG
ncbi:amino acid ABC transporter membrane protein 1 (PAAT family) [Rhizobium sp. PP-F2F-G48]|uniref:ABC transporter permease n=1 Tax=Rhizobium sp. PP-F2F-G48 TaxID=2135651 RepID=UPI0010DBF537|nr:ABC transporter permease [Rhizobium sp. PP-F2F-G48]TCM50674.1 amino acid ABC transporter membrane protein 1 (PAAT family) [Rhizobium sp. PP-F2F-G48]